jgi:hypothetical protein
VNELAERLQIHPYLAALGYALMSSPQGETEERDRLMSVWNSACRRYGIDTAHGDEILDLIDREVVPSE